MSNSVYMQYSTIGNEFEEYVNHLLGQIKETNLNEGNKEELINNLKKFIKIFINTLVQLNSNHEYIENHFKNIIDQLRENNEYDKLYILKKYIFNEEVILHYTNIISILNDTFHNVGIYCIKNGKLNNLDIINFIVEDSKVHLKEYQCFNRENTPEFVYLIENIKFDKIDSAFIKRFNEINFEGIFNGKNYNLFLNLISEKVNNFEYLQKLFFLFEKNIKKSEIFQMLNNIYRKENLLLIDRNDNIDLYCSVVSKYFELCTIKNCNEDITRKIINTTLSKFSQNNLYIEIFLNIISKSNHSNIKKSIKKDISYMLDSYIIKEDELMDGELSKNLKILVHLISNNYFNNDNYKDINYIVETKNVISEALRNIKDKKITLSKLMEYNQLMNNDEDNNRLLILTLGNRENCNELKKLINENCEYYSNYLEKIEEIIEILSTYYPESKDINKYKEEKKKILNNYINDIKILNIKNIYNQVHEITKIKESKFFREIYSYYKKLNSNDDNNKIEDSKETFNKLKYLFNFDDEEKIDRTFLLLLEMILLKIDENELNIEIDILIKIFEINNNNNSNNNNVYEKLKGLRNRERNCRFIEKILLLLKEFKVKKTDITKKLNNILDGLSEYYNLKNLYEKNKELDSFNFRVFNSKIQDIIYEMYNKPELIKFILNVLIKDNVNNGNNNDIDILKNMSEYIGDFEDIYLDISDIEKLTTCMEFIKKLKNKSNEEKEDEFLKKFVDLCEKCKNFKHIKENFANSSNKLNDFKELYNNCLNKNKLNKEHIKSIYQSSTFDIEIFYTDLKGKCIISYEINKSKIKKNFEEIEDLKNFALLKNYEKNRKNDFGDYNIFKNFIKIVNNVRVIISLLNSIVSKGYYEEVKYIIEINNGKAFACKKNKNTLRLNLVDTIEELNNIIKVQNNEVKFLYSSNPNTRMIYGKH
ncbi:hypothetical protein PIROE2DRAFT_6840 [Piromyces sp. E2]|nr:hypothetical protein PIROE2DRAFT_6840 [Piromyces sp. E2]|eukprot:OUM66043.1 hypothetical protein PIROE2DRAFT_6840 [Piromyces sp. E2]